MGLAGRSFEVRREHWDFLVGGEKVWLVSWLSLRLGAVVERLALRVRTAVRHLHSMSLMLSEHVCFLVVRLWT